MQITFTTRAGNRFTVEQISDLGHAIEARIIKGRWMGRIMVFAKNDMAIV